MTHRETLYTNYEDALFTLMMDSVAQSEGERLLLENARLNQDPDAALPESLLRRCQKTIDQAFAKQTRKTAGRATKKIVKLLPFVAIIIVMMAVLAYAAFPEFRSGVLNLMLKHNASSIDWSFEDDNGIDAQSDVPESPTFSVGLPEGYVLVDYWNNDAMEQADYQSKTAEDECISISVLHGEYTSTNTDIQESDYYEQILIQKYSAMLIVKDEQTCITWGDPDIPCYVTLRATGMDITAAKQLAESVIVQELQEK